MAMTGGQAASATRLPTPLYHQIYLILRSAILAGGYPKGSLLPSELQITDQYGVSRITARRALNELAADGLVRRQRGRGTVADFERTSAPIESAVEGLIENLLRMGLETEVEVLEFGYGPPPADVAEALACAPDAETQRVVRVRSLEGIPLSHLTTFVPADLGRTYSREELEQGPLLGLLERCGVVVSSARQTITAALADATLARALAVDPGSALLRVERIVHDQTGRAVEHLTALYRPDRYRIRMDLNRADDNRAGEDPVDNHRRRYWQPAAQ